MLVKTATHGKKIENQPIQIAHQTILEFAPKKDLLNHVRIEFQDCTQIGSELSEPIIKFSVGASADKQLPISVFLQKLLN
jgi:hypothetical protein